jgi:hypothetical protein
MLKSVTVVHWKEQIAVDEAKKNGMERMDILAKNYVMNLFRNVFFFQIIYTDNFVVLGTQYFFAWARIGQSIWTVTY